MLTFLKSAQGCFLLSRYWTNFLKFHLTNITPAIREPVSHSVQSSIYVWSNKMDLNWKDPDRREVATTATFIDSEAHKIHDGFRGSSKLDLERGEYVQFRPYL